MHEVLAAPWLHPGGGVAPSPEIQVAPGLTPRQAAVALLVMQPAPEIQDGCMVHLLLALLFAGRPRIFQQIYLALAIWTTPGHLGHFGKL